MFYRHKRKAIVGEVAQFVEDGKNDSLIASWFGIHPKRVSEVNALSAHTLNGVSRRVERGNSKAKTEGDYLIRTKTGGLYVCAEKDFEDHYVKVGSYVEREPEPKPPEEPKRVVVVPDRKPEPRLAPKAEPKPKPVEKDVDFASYMRRKKRSDAE